MHSIAFAATSLAAMLIAAPAQAQVAQTFVSATGSDSNNCADVTTPCLHFQNAVNATVPGGEVVALNPADYGPITINQPITINGQGWAYVTPAAGGTAITINANSGDTVTLRGLVLDGSGATDTNGTNGIVLNSGRRLIVTNCIMQNFLLAGTGPLGRGILMQPTSGTFSFDISNTTFLNNTFGIEWEPASGSPNAIGVIDHVTAIYANEGGSAIGFETGNAAGGYVFAAISNSDTSFNGAGIFADNEFSPSTIAVSIKNLTATNNFEGILANGTSNVQIGQSVITGNTYGIVNNTMPNTIYTYGDNQISQNDIADITGFTPTLNTLNKQ
jgi:nitrous oxidase accessory protein NosD